MDNKSFSATEVPVESRNRSWRLTFSYEGRYLQLVSLQSIGMRSPPSVPLTMEEDQSGFWYELQDKNRGVLYRYVIYNPIRIEAEIFSNDPSVPMRRVKIKNPRGTFQLLAPQIDEADSLVLFSSPLEPEHSGEPARELARFDLKSGCEGKAIHL